MPSEPGGLTQGHGGPSQKSYDAGDRDDLDLRGKSSLKINEDLGFSFGDALKAWCASVGKVGTHLERVLSWLSGLVHQVGFQGGMVAHV